LLGACGAVAYSPMGKGLLSGYFEHGESYKDVENRKFSKIIENTADECLFCGLLNLHKIVPIAKIVL